jgi:hypothetical protein
MTPNRSETMHHPDTRDQMEADTAGPPADAPRGWQSLCCPRCGEETQICMPDLADLSRFECVDCGAEFTAGDVEAIIAAWTPVLAWLRQAPVKE